MRPNAAPRPYPLLAAALLALGACDSPLSVQDPAPAVEATLVAQPSPAGRAAFVDACAGCHASGDGFDLAVFSFPDSAIVRRAVFHVDSSTARAIVQHVRSLAVSPLARDARPFQVPRAASDVDFARRLFGADAWPAGIGEKEMLAMDPSRVAAAVRFPVWSDEATNLDWMPGAPLPPAVLGPFGSDVRKALAAYRAQRSDPNLVRAVSVIRRAAVARESGPCAQVDDGALADPATCFEATRWAASLGAQHALRTGATLRGPLAGSTAVQDAFWDVGQAARRSLLKNRTPVPEAEANWVSWMYLGWVLAPGNHASGYTASGLARAGLPRHATFVALRSMAARPQTSHHGYADLATAAAQAPTAWLGTAYATGLSVLEARAGRGWIPATDTGRDEARMALERASATLTRRLGAAKAEPLLVRTRGLAAGI